MEIDVGGCSSLVLDEADLNAVHFATSIFRYENLMLHLVFPCGGKSFKRTSDGFLNESLRNMPIRKARRAIWRTF